ncbi:MAG: hypothetical protein QOK05_2358 [Chloroflexota bacterium]|jgi:hypothetical protein|nr:hypothetical protein [Chloroflexota bacterium]
MRRAKQFAASLTLCLVPLGAAAPMAATPAHASVVVDGTCDVTMTISSPLPITKTPAFIGLGYDGLGTCAGYPFVTQGMSFGGTGYANISCDVFETFGSSFTFVFAKTAGANTSASTGAGTLSSVNFVMPGVNTLTFDAVGTFAWSNASQQTACATGGIQSVTLTGVIVFQDPTIDGVPPS